MEMYNGNEKKKRTDAMKPTLRYKKLSPSAIVPTYGSAAAIRYVSNKIKASDSCEIIEGGKGIALTSGNILSVIYSGGEGLYEKTLPFGSEATAEGGDIVVKSAGMTVSETDKMYEIALSCGDDDFSVFVRKG